MPNAKANSIDVNHAFTQITGYKRDEVMGMNPHLLGSGQHGQDQFATMWQGLLDQGFWSGEISRDCRSMIALKAYRANPGDQGRVAPMKSAELPSWHLA